MFSKIGYLLRAPVFFILKPEKQIESFDWWSKKTNGHGGQHSKSPQKGYFSLENNPLKLFSTPREV